MERDTHTETHTHTHRERERERERETYPGNVGMKRVVFLPSFVWQADPGPSLKRRKLEGLIWMNIEAH